MEQIIKEFILAFAEAKNIPVDQLVSIELGQKVKYVYVDGKSVHLVEEGLDFGNPDQPTE